MSSLPAIHMINVVWGKKMTDLFFDHILPSQLTMGNYGAFKGIEVTYKIFTSKEDEIEIRKKKWFHVLCKLFQTQFLSIEPPLEQDKYCLMANCHNQAIKEANACRGALIFLAPDAIFSEGSMQYLIDRIRKGKRLVLEASLRIVQEDFLKKLKKIGYPENKREISSRELASWALDSLHPFCLRQKWGEKKISSWLSHINWQNIDSLLVRAFHLHPLFIWPSKEIVSARTIDYDYYAAACPDKSSWEIVDDSDKLLVCDLTKANFALMDKMSCNTSKAAFWAYKHTDMHHREFIHYKIWIHSREKINDRKKIEMHSDKIIQEISAKTSFFSFLKDPRWIIWNVRQKYHDFKDRLRRFFTKTAKKFISKNLQFK